MKKLLFLIFLLLCAAGVLYLHPNLIPLKVKKMGISHYTKSMPGSITFKEAEITSDHHFLLYDFSWSHKDIVVKIPLLKIDAPITSIYSGEQIPIILPKGQMFYKRQLLLDNIRGSISFTKKENILSLSRKCSIDCSIVESGTKAFLNHSIIPPFSGDNVTLTLKKGSFNTEKKNHYNLSGILSLHTLSCTENHLLSVILKILKSEPQSRIPVSCGDIIFAIENGIASYRKTPFLVDSIYNIVSKGTVNFPSNSLNLSVGILADAIKRAFNIGHLPDNYMIPFKIDGKISKPTYHTKEALASIAAIILLKKIAPESRTLPKSSSF